MPELVAVTEVSIEFEVFCTCGNGLCGVARVSYGRKMPQISVEPCERCLTRAHDKGYDEGYDKGAEEN